MRKPTLLDLPDEHKFPLLDLPNDVLCLMASYLNGSYVEIIIVSPEKDFPLVTLEQRKTIKDLNAYCLVMHRDRVGLGFRDQNGDYDCQVVDVKSSLHEYVQRNRNSLLPGVTREKELLELVEKEIKVLSGCVNHPARDLSQFAETSKKLNTLLGKGYAGPNSFFKGCLKQQAFDALLLSAARNEPDKVKRILEGNPDLFFRQSKGYMNGSDYFSRTFKDATAFKIALWQGAWGLYTAMLDCIPKDQEEQYYAELLKQYDEIITSLEVMSIEPDDKNKKHVEQTKNYLLILRNLGCYLGFCGADGKYTETLLLVDDELSNYFNSNPMEIGITVDNTAVDLATKIVKTCGGCVKVGLEYTLNHLALGGLGIIDRVPKLEEQQHAQRFNTFHFILGENGSCALGFRNPTSGDYVQKPLDDNSQLKRHIGSVEHRVVRDSRTLELATVELEAKGARIHVTYQESHFNLKPLINAYKDYIILSGANQTPQHRIWDYCWAIGMLQRSSTPDVMKMLMMAKFDEKTFFQQQGDKDREGIPYLPLQDDLAPSMAYWGGYLHDTTHRPSRVVKDEDLPMLEAFDKARLQNLVDLRQRLVQGAFPSLSLDSRL